jgi:hypothetical protein
VRETQLRKSLHLPAVIAKLAWDHKIKGTNPDTVWHWKKNSRGKGFSRLASISGAVGRAFRQ